MWNKNFEIPPGRQNEPGKSIEFLLLCPRWEEVEATPMEKELSCAAQSTGNRQQVGSVPRDTLGNSGTPPEF